MMDTWTELRANVKIYFDLYLANNGLPGRLAQPGINTSVTLRKK